MMDVVHCQNQGNEFRERIQNVKKEIESLRREIVRADIGGYPQIKYELLQELESVNNDNNNRVQLNPTSNMFDKLFKKKPKKTFCDLCTLSLDEEHSFVIKTDRKKRKYHETCSKAAVSI